MPNKDSKKRPKDVNLAEKKIADIKTLEVVTEPKKELSEVQIPKNAASEEQIPKEVEESPKDSGEKEVGEDGPSHQGLKKKALLVNSKISEYAKTRNLSKAKHEFRRFQKQSPDYVSVHTYTCLINACVRSSSSLRFSLTFICCFLFVRCDRTDEAFALFEEMKQAGIVANAVTHTTLLKGLCNSGKLIQAHRHLVSMQAEGIEANSRTYDTLLRACARHGHAKLARALFAGILKHQLSPSQTSYECYIRALCINLEVEEAWRVAGAMQAANLAQNTAVFLELARASALVGDVPNCQKALWINDEVGPKGGGLDDLYKIGTKILERESKDQVERNEASSLCGTTLSERSKAHKKKELANKRSQALFAGHRAKIVESESAQVRAYLASVGTVGPRLPKLTFAPNRNDIPYMLFVTSSSPGGTIATSMTTSTHVPGLRAFQTSIWPAKYRTLLKSEPIHSASSSAANLEAAGADEQKQVATLLGLGSMAGGKTTLAINTTCIAPPARVCLELCSGVGDWVVAQAKQDSSVFSAAESAERHWIAVELLMDRAFTVWSKRAFEGLQNLTVVQGDARAVLRGSEDSEAETSVVNEQQSKKKLKLAISQQTAGNNPST
jgi:pentatricopeptide repeat protein